MTETLTLAAAVKAAKLFLMVYGMVFESVANGVAAH
jgi:hypothetical protein